MKRLLLAFALTSVLSFTQGSSILAQGVNISVNIGNQPAWGPAGYDYAAYYYFPDIDVYYDVNSTFFYFFDRGSWRTARYLPYRYNRYDLYGMYKVVINEPEPWRYHNRYRSQYAQFRGNHNQIIILNSPDRRYDRVRHNRVEWINPNRPGRYPNNSYGSNHRPNQRPGNGNRPNGSGRPDLNQRPEGGNNNSGYNKPNNNDRPIGNNNRPNGNVRPNQNQRPGNGNNNEGYNRPSNNDRPEGNNRPNGNNKPNNKLNNNNRPQQRTSSNRQNEVRSSGRNSNDRSVRSNDNKNKSSNQTNRSSRGRE